MMSVGFLLASPSDAVIWRGPKKNGKRHLIIFVVTLLKPSRQVF